MLEYATLSAINPSPLSVIIPVFNQATDVETELSAWRQTLEELKCGHELLVVDAGSLDNTCDVVRKIQLAGPEVRLLRNDKKRGFGAALTTGLQAAKHPLIVYATSGEGYQPAALLDMLKWIDEVHLVAGYRVSSDGKAYRTPSWKRRLSKTVFGVPMRDLGCFFVMARRTIFEHIPIQSRSTVAHFEVLAKANFIGSLMTEVPVRVNPSVATHPGWSTLPAQIRTELMKLFHAPDFGPVIKKEERESDASVTSPPLQSDI